MVLIDQEEILFRIYLTSQTEWKLYHFHSSLLPKDKSLETSDILESIGSFFSSDYAQHIAEWKICTRHLPQSLCQDITRALAIPVENLSLHREQELLCKGMFTELW